MKRKPKTRPGLLVRLHKEDLARLTRAAEASCTPREAYARRAINNAVEVTLRIARADNQQIA